ncbi:MAG: carbon-nitrogen hydrolase family protein [Polyangiales bacterium]
MTLVAVTQMTSNDDVSTNLDVVEGNVAKAVARGAELVLVPECFAFMGREEDYFGISEVLPRDGETGGPIYSRCAAMARAHQVEIIFGGFWERGDERVRNASVQIRADGSLGEVYRKIHLFDVDLADGTKLCESAMVEAGTETVLAQTPAGPVGMSICYDLRFSGLYRELVDQAAKILTVPAAFTLMTGKDHWEVLLRARAIEQQSYVLASAQVGSHVFVDGSGTRQSWGHAMIIDPWGTVLAQCGAGEGVAVADIDLAEVDRVRRQLPSLRHRRR